MNLPSGVPQNSACVLIAMREYFNDPSWEDDDLVSELRNRNTSDKVQARAGAFAGYPIDKMPALLERAGMFTHSLGDNIKVLNSEGSNADEFEVQVGKGVRYSFPRNAKTVFCYYTDKAQKNLHAMCIPLHVAVCFAINARYGWKHIGIDATDMQFLGVKR